MNLLLFRKILKGDLDGHRMFIQLEGKLCVLLWVKKRGILGGITLPSVKSKCLLHQSCCRYDVSLNAGVSFAGK